MTIAHLNAIAINWNGPSKLLTVRVLKDTTLEKVSVCSDPLFRLFLLFLGDIHGDGSPCSSLPPTPALENQIWNSTTIIIWKIKISGLVGPPEPNSRLVARSWFCTSHQFPSSQCFIACGEVFFQLQSSRRAATFFGRGMSAALWSIFFRITKTF